MVSFLELQQVNPVGQGTGRELVLLGTSGQGTCSDQPAQWIQYLQVDFFGKWFAELDRDQVTGWIGEYAQFG